MDNKIFSNQDLTFMRLALAEAEVALSLGEVPVGALLVENDAVLARNCNRNISETDPSAHAEMLVLREAAKKIGNYRLPNCTLYVTLEPCPMCAAALLHARVKRLVFAANDPKTGAAGGLVNLFASSMNHQTDTLGGVCADHSSQMLRAYFKGKRLEQRASVNKREQA